MLDIKEALVKIIKKEKVEDIIVVHKDAYSKNESVEEMPIDTLLMFSTFFIEAYVLDQNKGSRDKVMELSSKYCEECEYYEIVSKRFAEVRLRVMGSGFSREDRVLFLNQKSSFLSLNHRWDCREWVMDLLRYLYVQSVELYNHSRIESMLESCPKENIAAPAGIRCMKIDSRGLRKKMLVSRNNPTMTLAEFSDKLMHNMEMMKQTVPENAVHDSEEEELESLRGRDEFRDDAHCTRGNTHGKG